MYFRFLVLEIELYIESQRQCREIDGGNNLQPSHAWRRIPKEQKDCDFTPLLKYPESCLRQ